MEGNKSLFEISSKIFRTDSHEIVLKSLLLSFNHLFLSFRSKSVVKNITRTSNEITLKSLLLTLHKLFPSIKLPMLTINLPIAEVYVGP